MKGQVNTQLVVIFSSILAVVLIVMSIQAVSKAFGNNGEEVTNEDAIESLVSRLAQTPTESTLNASYLIDFSTRDMFLFFSVGEDPIILEYQREDDTYQDFIFERPEECMKKSCVCHCKDELWTSRGAQPYLQLANIRPGEAFRCLSLTCEAVNDAYFMNSRGYDAEFVDPRVNQVSEDSQIHISMDIPSLLIQQERSYVHIFESMDAIETKGVNNIYQYNYDGQNTNFVRSILEQYRWKNGVVIGGMGLVMSERDGKNYRILGPQASIRLEKTKDSEVIGVCIYERCLFEKGKEAAQQQLEVQEVILDFDNRMNILQNNFDVFVPECLAEATNQFEETKCLLVNLQGSSLKSFFDEEQEEIIPQLKFYEHDNGEVFVQLILSVKEDEDKWSGLVGDEFPIAYDLPKLLVDGVVQDFPGEIIITDVSGDDLSLITIGGVLYTMSSARNEDDKFVMAFER